MRRIFVGDIQGCLEPLERLLVEVGFVPGSDVLHPTGDLVNKGPDSIGVLRRMVDLDARPVIGNHDLRWLQRGRIDDPSLASWLSGQPVVRMFDDLILVHAGLHPHWDEAELTHLDGSDVDFAVTVRYCTAEGELPACDWPAPGPPYFPWDTFYRGAKRVVFGHWARRGLDLRDSVICLDSGCVYGGKLSAWIAEEDRVVQVPSQPNQP